MSSKIEATLRIALGNPSTVLGVSGDIETLLGYTAEQFLDAEIQLVDLIHPHDHDIADELFADANGETQGNVTFRLRQANGRIRCVKGWYLRDAGDGAQPVLELRLIDVKSLHSSTATPPLTANFVAMMENTNDFIYFKDRNHVFTGASQTLVAITDPSEHWTDLLGLTDYDVFPEEYADAYYRLEKQVFAGITVAHEIQQTLTTDGRKGWVDNRKCPIKDEHGNIIGLFGIARDITEQKRAEEAFRAGESFLRTIIDEIPDPIVLKDHKGDFLLGNQAVAMLYNTTPEAMVGKHDGDFGVPQAMSDFFRENVLGIMARGQTEVVFEDSRDANSGEIFHYRSIKKPFKNAAGEDQILVVAQNITDVIRAQQKVAESEHRLQQVMEITREGIWDWHLPSGKVIHNPQWYKTLLFEPDELAETVEAFALLIHPDDKESVWKHLDDLLSGASDSYHSEHRLLRKDGSAIWVQDRGRIVDRDADGKPTRVIGSFSDISFLKAHQHHLEHIAHYDALTGLPNRVLLADRMHQAMVHAKRRGQQLVVAYLDLDGFKEVNDRYGHDVGDQLLTSIAAQFKTALREGDTMARLGGDEFVAVFVDLPDVHASMPLIRRLLDVAAKTITVDKRELQVSASIGVSFYPQVDETDADQLLRQADQAMYHAKLAGKNRFHLFDAEQDRTQRVRHESLEQIRAALANDEFVLHYQPKVNLRSGAVIGAEALVRWQHPERGLLAPMVFLPGIEGHALGIALGEWVLDTALTQIERWADQGIDLPVSVNMSAHHLQQPNFAEKLSTRLASHPKVQAGRLELEVLETSALEDINSVSDIITACAELGVGFALDDFGTGYSSLTYLKRLPAQMLKIDQSFVRDMLEDPEDLAILEGVLGLAMAFRRQAIAEGVETLAHCALLLRLGCDLAQGFGIARPMVAEKMADWLAIWRPDPSWLKLSAVSRDDLPVIYATVEHRAWVAAIEACLLGASNEPPVLDHQHCRLRSWLDNDGRKRYGGHPAFAQIETLHHAVHESAINLLKLHAEKRTTETDEALQQLHALRDALTEHIIELLSQPHRSTSVP